MPEERNFVAEHDQFLKMLDIEIVSASPEYALVRMPLSDRHRNGCGAAHGGVIGAICDAAFGAASNSGSRYAVVTTSLDVDFLRPGLKGPIQAEARLVHAGRRMVNYDVQVRDGDSQLIARAMVNGYITDMALDGVIAKEVKA